MKLLANVIVACSLAFAPVAFAAKYEPPAEGTTNPPATEALSNFQRFEHRPLAVAPALAGEDSIESARAHLQANMELRSVERVRMWNEATAATAGDAPRTLVIEPFVDHARFVTPGKRAFLGVLWGSSYMEVRVRLTDAATGAVIGEPRFYQRAGAGAAGWAFGAVDRAMLIRIANMVDAYLRDNHAAPVATRVDLMADDTPEQSLEKQQMETRAAARNPQG